MLDVAIDATKAGGQLAYQYFTKVKNVRYKGDNSPVTIADIEAEKLIRKIITQNFPDHGIIGEELQNTNPKSKYQWVIDPIDGTKQFVRGIPIWTTYVAVLENGKPIIGVSYASASNELIFAQKNKGTFLNSKKVHVSKTSNIKEAYLSFSALNHFQEKNKLSGFLDLCNTVHSHRGYGDSLGYHLLVKGQIDIMLEAQDKIWDVAAPAILVEEAGGKFTDFTGKFSITSGVAVATNGILHEKVLEILNG